MNQDSHFDLLFTHCALATMAGARYGKMENAALGVKSGKIAWNGSMAELAPGATAERTIDAAGKWLLPGFVDCHTHLIWGGSRSDEFEMRLQGATYEEIAKKGGGIFSTVSATRAASEDQLFEAASKRVSHFLEQGITTLEIKSGYGLDLDTERKMLAVAGRLNRAFPQEITATFLGAHALPPEFKDRSGRYIDLVVNTMLPAIKDQGIARAVDVFCERIAFSRDETQQVFQKALDLGFAIKLHAEQLSDSDGAALAAGMGALSCDHLEYLSRQGAEAMAKNGTTAVLLPGAFFYLRETQLPPVEWFRELNIPMAVSTDLNPGSSPVHAMTQVMNMSCLLFGLTCEEALAGATLNGARALGLADRKGSLETGKDADLALWDIDSPADLCYLSGCTPLEMVVTEGEIAYTRS